MEKITNPVAIALGSNLGDRRGHLAFAVERLQRVVDDMRVSQVRETMPVGVDTSQLPYLNAVLVGHTAMGAAELLSYLLELERERGRERPYSKAPRTLDLDLILFGDRVINRPELQVPHPRFRDRGFVLEPLAELTPDWVDPVSGKSVLALFRALGPGT